MGLAQTGTGKTAAFALPILQQLLERPGRGPLALVLAPTRELAIQIEAEVRTLAKFTDVQTVAIFGGVPARKQIQALRRRPEIAIGCPGRVLDLHGQGALDLSRVETLVLDEADHMFDMGFLPDVRKILAALPRDRQNLLFSATMPKAIRELSERILGEPHVVEIGHTRPVEQIEHALYPIAEGGKRALLDHLLAENGQQTAIVFTRTKHRAKRLALQLSKQGRRAVALQGNMSQSQRDQAMRGFRASRFDILVATDIAARGLDVAGIGTVINFDPPSTPDTYTHRIGRTGRSGASGKACTFVTRDDAPWVRAVERALGSPIPRRHVSGFDREELPPGGRTEGPQRAAAGPRQQTRTPRGSRVRSRRAKWRGTRGQRAGAQATSSS